MLAIMAAIVKFGWTPRVPPAPATTPFEPA
jgi:hypothetical protein